MIANSRSSLTQMAPRAKPDTLSGTETAFNDWLKYFELCASINGWSEVQSRQQLAIQLRGRAQRLYTSLQNEELQTYDGLVSALRDALDPPQQRAIHKLAFRNRQRTKLLEQFINALYSRKLRLGGSQTFQRILTMPFIQL